MRTSMRSLFESLFYALVLSPLAYVGFWLVADHGMAPERIVIDDAQVESIRAQFRGTWSRNPTYDEMRGLIQTMARSEILYREGEALGLGRNDPAVSRRVRQKYESLANARLAGRVPTDEEVADW